MDENEVVESYVVNTAGFPQGIPDNKMDSIISNESELSWSSIKEEYRACLTCLQQEFVDKEHKNYTFTATIETDKLDQHELSVCIY